MEIKPFKIQVTPEESEIVQEALFANGYKWFGDGEVRVQSYEILYLYFYEHELETTLSLFHGNDIDVFKKDPLPELTFQQFKELYIDKIEKTINIPCEEFTKIPINYIKEHNSKTPEQENRIMIDFNPVKNLWVYDYFKNYIKNTKKIEEKQVKTPDYVRFNGDIVPYSYFLGMTVSESDKVEYLYSEPPTHELKYKPDKQLKKIVKRLDVLIERTSDKYWTSGLGNKYKTQKAQITKDDFPEVQEILKHINKAIYNLEEYQRNINMAMDIGCPKEETIHQKYARSAREKPTSNTVNMKNKQWFIDRIGKRVWRKNDCDCIMCIASSEFGVLIRDEQHADYLFSLECECGFKYFDSKEERDDSVNKSNTDNLKGYHL